MPYLRHVRHGNFDRIRYSLNLLNWLNTQSTRLSKTSKEVYELLKTNTVAQVEAMEPPGP